LVSKRRASSAFDLRAFEKKLSIFCSQFLLLPLCSHRIAPM
jgi:hypothetical protein